jgi:tRNA (cytidine/uridine-2'-O-)-methyltransferase
MTALHVVLVAPEIHWNTGNVGRTCLAVGAELHLVQPLGFSLSDKHRATGRARLLAARSRQGLADWEALAAELPRLGTPYFFVATGSSNATTRSIYPEPTVLVFGCESVGLPSGDS